MTSSRVWNLPAFSQTVSRHRFWFTCPPACPCVVCVCVYYIVAAWHLLVLVLFSCMSSCLDRAFLTAFSVYQCQPVFGFVSMLVFWGLLVNKLFCWLSGLHEVLCVHSLSVVNADSKFTGLLVFPSQAAGRIVL